jgi:hypothetical protein
MSGLLLDEFYQIAFGQSHRTYLEIIGCALFCMRSKTARTKEGLILIIVSQMDGGEGRENEGHQDFPGELHGLLRAKRITCEYNSANLRARIQLNEEKYTGFIRSYVSSHILGRIFRSNKNCFAASPANNGGLAAVFDGSRHLGGGSHSPQTILAA